MATCRYKILLITGLLAISCDSNDPVLEESKFYPDLSKITLMGDSFKESRGGIFIPWGFNYTHTDVLGLIEDNWEAESTWVTIESDFAEMLSYGANLVRIHLQTHNYLTSPTEVNTTALNRLLRIVDIAEKYGVYLDITGLASYRKADDPSWYRNLSDEDRWTSHATFWSAISETLANKEIIFAYNLMNEPVSVNSSVPEWLAGDGLGGFHFVQRINRNPNGRTALQSMRVWMGQMTTAIRAHDSETPITVGFLPLGNPVVYEQDLDFVSVHVYPDEDNPSDSQDFVTRNQGSKPLLLEETFTLYMSADDLGEFVSQGIRSGELAGVLSHYDGKTLEEKKISGTIQDAVREKWLEKFIEINPNREN